MNLLVILHRLFKFVIINFIDGVLIMENNLESIAEFIINNYLYDLMYDDFDMPNISFNFKEKEAVEFINSIINKNIEKNFNKKYKIYDGINNVDYNNPVIEIANYKLFFESIDKLAKSIYNLCNYKVKSDKKINYLSFNSLIKYLWLRMTPDDFKNPEDFLLKNIEMTQNSIFDKYYNSDGFLIDLDDERQVFFKNKVTSSFDEENKELLFYIKTKNNEKDYLPVIRYGIYKENNENICEIGSVQSFHRVYNDNYKIVNCLRNKINKNIPGDLKNNVEPKKVLSLLFFIKLLQDNNIYKISIPSMYVLDYDFHKIWYQNDYDVFLSKWTDYRKELYPDQYEEEKYVYSNQLSKIDSIIENKTIGFIHTFERLMYHIPEIEIIEYPNEVSSYMRLRIPKENSIDNVIKILKKS